MAQTLENQVKALVGDTIPARCDLDTILADGCKDIIRRISISTPEDLWMFTTSADLTDSAGLAVGSSKIYDVSRGTDTGTYEDCRPIGPNQRHKVTDKDSIFYANGEFPVYYLMNNKVFVLPTPLTGVQIGITVFATHNGGSQTKITAGTHGVAIGNVIEITNGDENTNGSYYVGHWEVLSVPDADNFVIGKKFGTNDNGYYLEKSKGVVSYIADHTVDADSTSDPDTGTISNFPQSYVPLTILYGAMGVLLSKAADLHESFPSLVLPAAPVVPDLDTTTASLPTYTSPSAFLLPAPPENVNVDFSGISSPTYSEVSAPVMDVLNFSTSSITIAAADLGVEVPAPPTLPDFGSTDTDFSTTVRSKAPTYVKPVFTAPTFPTIDDFEGTEPPVPPTEASFTDAQTDAADSNIPNYPAPVLGDLQFSSVDTSIDTDEDPEMAGVKLNKIQAQIAEFQGRAADAVNVWQDEMALYKAKIEQAVTNAANQLSSDNQEYQAKLTTYQAKLQAYQIENTQKLADWTKNNLENKFTKWVTEFQNKLSEYQADIQNELNDFQKENAEYQAEIQKALGDATNKIGDRNNEANIILSKYSAEVQSYQTKTQTVITEWQQRVAQVGLQEFTQKRSDELAEWTAKNGNLIQLYGGEVTANKSSFDSDFQVYTQKINKRLQTYSAETGYDMSKYQAEVQSAAQLYQFNAQKELENFKSNLEKYATEQQTVTAKNQDKLAQFQAEGTIFQADSGNVINKYSAKVQSSQAEMQWILDKYATVSAKYETGFITQQPTNEQQQKRV
jgi:hypothetical protein